MSSMRFDGGGVKVTAGLVNSTYDTNYCTVLYKSYATSPMLQVLWMCNMCELKYTPGVEEYKERLCV